ncbi:MAG: hypothetical protein AAF399_20685 [Bacteroidota bacterium]
MLILCFLVLWLGKTHPIQAQVPSPSWQLSYMGETVWHSGLGLAYEQAFQPSFLKEKPGRQLRWAGQLAYFSHRKVHRSLMIQGRLGYHLQIHKNWELGGLLGIGVRRYWLASPTFVQTDDGFTQRNGAGGWQILPGLGGEIRWLPKPERGFFLRPWLMQGFPHGIGSLSLFFLEIGYSQSLPPQP